MTAADFAPIIQAIVTGVVAVIAAVFTAVVTIYVPKAIAAIEKRTGVQITDQERAAIMSAVTTGAGLLQTKLDQGVLKIADITPLNPNVRAAAVDVVNRVPDSVAAQGTSADTVAAMIVARVDTSPKPLIVPASPDNLPIPAFLRRPEPL